MASGNSARLRIESDRLLLVEGRDEVNLFKALIRHQFGERFDVQVVEAGGKDQLPKSLQAIKIEAQTRPTFRSVGVVRDADDNPEGAFQSVCDHLNNARYVAPDAHGTFSEAVPSVGIFIVPDGVHGGAIETLCRQSVQESPAAQCVEQYLDCLNGNNAMESANRDKSFAHAYLAATHDPVARVGEGAQRGTWDFQSPVFGELLSFIQNLYDRGCG